MNYKAVKRGGKYIFAGFSNPPPFEVGDVVEEYPDSRGDIVAAIKAGRPKKKTASGETFSSPSSQTIPGSGTASPPRASTAGPTIMMRRVITF